RAGDTRSARSNAARDAHRCDASRARRADCDTRGAPRGAGDGVRANAARSRACDVGGVGVMNIIAALALTFGIARPVVVASKPFGESYLLAEMFAQLLEARGIEVDRRPGLGATEIAFRALRTNAIDVYPEYTGTGLLAILGEQPVSSASVAYQRVSSEFLARYGARWLPPLGFENTYAISVRRATADSL